MSIALTVNKTYDGPRRAAIQANAMTVDDAAASNLTLATLVNLKTLDPVPESVRVETISGGVEYGVVELYWEALPPVRFAVLSGNSLNFDYAQAGALRPPTDGTNVTGNILISTVGFAPTSTLMLDLGLIKRVL